MKLLRKQQIAAATMAAALILAAFYIDYRHAALKPVASLVQAKTGLSGQFIGPQTPPVAVTQSSAKVGTKILLPILMYHHVGSLPPQADPVRIGLTVSPQQFKEQVQWLSQNGYRSVTLSQLYGYSQGKKPANWPAKPVIFTFDDGYQDVFDNAIPVLQQYGYTGAFGIITDNPGQTQGTNVYASWQQIGDAKKAGMEIVCHTENHFDGSNPKFDDSYIYQNLSGCQQQLQTHVGSAEPFLIYPYGHYTTKYLADAKKAGFVMALTVRDDAWLNLSGPMTLPRVRISPTTTLKRFQELVTWQFPQTATSSPGLYAK